MEGDIWCIVKHRQRTGDRWLGLAPSPLSHPFSAGFSDRLRHPAAFPAWVTLQLEYTEISTQRSDRGKRSDPRRGKPDPSPHARVSCHHRKYHGVDDIIGDNTPMIRQGEPVTQCTVSTCDGPVAPTPQRCGCEGGGWQQ